MEHTQSATSFTVYLQYYGISANQFRKKDRPRMLQRTGLQCLIIPTQTVLNARTLAGAGRKLTTSELCDLIEELIEELDVRAGDADFEFELFEE